MLSLEWLKIFMRVVRMTSKGLDQISPGDALYWRKWATFMKAKEQIDNDFDQIMMKLESNPMFHFQVPNLLLNGSRWLEY